MFRFRSSIASHRLPSPRVRSHDMVRSSPHRYLGQGKNSMSRDSPHTPIFDLGVDADDSIRSQRQFSCQWFSQFKFVPTMSALNYRRHFSSRADPLQYRIFPSSTRIPWQTVTLLAAANSNRRVKISVDSGSGKVFLVLLYSHTIFRYEVNSYPRAALLACVKNSVKQRCVRVLCTSVGSAVDRCRENTCRRNTHHNIIRIHHSVF